MRHLLVSVRHIDRPRVGCRPTVNFAYAKVFSLSIHHAIMSNEPLDQAFWHRVNTIINSANDQCDSADPNHVTASTMYAAARFNAFIVASSTGNAENMKLEKQRALDHFTEQFRSMMAENLDDFIANFDRYMEPVPPQ